MKRILPILLLLLPLLAGLAPLTAQAQTAQELIDSGQLIIRSRLEPEGNVLVGQKVTLWIEVLTSTWFTSAPQLPQTLEIPKAVVVMPDTFGINRTERINGATYAGQSRRYLIFPQGAGNFETPPVPLTLTVARESGGSSPELRVEAPGQRSDCERPPGSEGLGLVLAAPGLQVSEQWDPSPGELNVGEALTRTVTVTIDDAVAMLLPPLEMEPLEGVGLYPGKPELDDRSNRGQLTGSRTDSVTLIMEEEGDYSLPEVVYHWWDLERGILKKEVLPAVSFTVAANPDLAADHLGEKPVEEEAMAAVVEGEDQDGAGRLYALVAGGVLVLLLIFRRRLARLPAVLAERKRRRTAGEASYFNEFRKAAGGGDPAAAMVALMAWLDRFAGGPDAASLQQFVQQAADQELTEQVEALNRAVYGAPPAIEGGAPRGGWSGKRFARLVARGRGRVMSGRQEQQLEPAALPPLNPGAGGNG